jgi:hypothetical protein
MEVSVNVVEKVIEQRSTGAEGIRPLLTAWHMPVMAPVRIVVSHHALVGRIVQGERVADTVRIRRILSRDDFEPQPSLMSWRSIARASRRSISCLGKPIVPWPCYLLTVDVLHITDIISSDDIIAQ